MSTVAILGALALALIPATAAHADPPRAIPANANWGDAKWQPALDYDTDGCYSSPAIDAQGNQATGLNTSGALNGSCRDASDLDNTNSYSRAKCNNGWCAHMYASYFEKDQMNEGSGGHRHDLEHIVVWVQNDQAQYVSVSQHQGFKVASYNDVPREGTHPKIVYNKDGGLTHVFRFANNNDEPPENHYGRWQYPALISWDNYPAGVRDKFVSYNYGGATLAIKDDTFPDALNRAKPSGIAFDPWGPTD